jgi:hypothetical protein
MPNWSEFAFVHYGVVELYTVPPGILQFTRGGAFHNGRSALMLAAARLRHVAGTRRGTRRYLDMNRLAEANGMTAQAKPFGSPIGGGALQLGSCLKECAKKLDTAC